MLRDDVTKVYDCMIACFRKQTFRCPNGNPVGKKIDIVQVYEIVFLRKLEYSINVKCIKFHAREEDVCGKILSISKYLSCECFRRPCFLISRSFVSFCTIKSFGFVNTNEKKKFKYYIAHRMFRKFLEPYLELLYS